MRILCVWLGAAAAVSLGYMAGDRSGDPRGVTIVALATLAIALLCPLVVALVPRIARLRIAVFAGLCLALARGLVAGAEDRGSTWRAAAPGHPEALRELVVERASTSQGTCRFRARPNVLVSSDTATCPIWSGSRVRIAADVGIDRLVALPGGADPRRSAHARGAIATLTVARAWPAGSGRSPYWEWVARERDRAWRSSRGSDARSLVVAGVLGLRGALPPGRRDALRASGLGHLIAVSGMHVAIAAWLVCGVALRIGAAVRWSPRTAIAISWLPLAAYVGLTGASASAVRAAAMLLVLGIGALSGRPRHGLTVLAVVAAAMLLAQPGWTIDVGFHFSVAAMVVLLRAPPGCGPLALTWRVAWAVAPLSLLYFGHASAYGIVTNLAAIPLFALWVLPLGAVGWSLSPWLGPIALAPASWGAQLILDISDVFGALPSPPAWAMATLAAVLLAVRVLPHRSRPRWFDRAVPPALACAGMLAVLGAPPRSVAPMAPWYAVGRPRSLAVLASGTDVRGRATTCLLGPTLAAHRWPSLIRALGIEAIGRVEPEGAQAEPLRAVLHRVGLLGRPAATCDPPDTSALRRIARSCARRQAPGRRIAIAGPVEAPRCFTGAAWVRLPSSARPRSPP